MEHMGKIQEALKEGIEGGVFPGAVFIMGRSNRVLSHSSIGYASIEPEKMRMRKFTIFDLASLTKPLATALAIMKLVNDDVIKLDQNLHDLFGSVIPDDKKEITIRRLLSHCSGLPDWRPFYKAVKSNELIDPKKTIRNLVLETPLDYEPGTRTVYSDLGYILLEWVVNRASSLSLPEFLNSEFYVPLGLKWTFFQSRSRKPRFSVERYAATERCPWRGQVIRGHVHDENAYAMGGYSGHAGLFSTAADVYSLCACLLQHYYGQRSDLLQPRVIQQFFERQNRPIGTTWALGWDTPSPSGSSTGRFFSRNSVGHLGFTGTSIWMDLDRDLIVVFLSNRIHPTRGNEKIKNFRPRLHDAVINWFDAENG